LQKDPLSGDFLHIDFYQPDLEKEVTALVPIKIIGESGAVKNKEGTLIKNANELEVRALPLNLPHELIVNIDSMKEFGDEIFVRDIELPEGVKILKNANDVLITVSAPTDVEHELEKEIEEKVEDIETIGKTKEGEDEEIETEEEIRVKDQESKKPARNAVE
ncbi:50S ribosomal protein L25, partial [Patescibacteria group bacterium]|nr:50S ribosomal protein L25 [Patescibacteria group bacterium]